MNATGSTIEEGDNLANTEDYTPYAVLAEDLLLALDRIEGGKMSNDLPMGVFLDAIEARLGEIDPERERQFHEERMGASNEQLKKVINRIRFDLRNGSL